MRRLLAISFLISCLLIWLAIYLIFGSPGLLRGPWTLEQMAALKKQELTVYWLAVTGIPLLSIFISRLLRRCFPSLIERPSAGEPVNRPSLIHPQNKYLLLRYRIVAGFALPCFLYGTLWLSNINRGVSSPDEGLRVAAASQVRYGKKPYTGIYFQYGPGSEIIQPLAAFKWFGDSLASHRRLERIIFPMGALAAYFLCYVALQGHPLVLAFPLVLLGRPDAWVSPRAALALTALAFLLLGNREKKSIVRRRILVGSAGVLTVGAFFYSMEAGLLLAPAIGLFLGFCWWQERRHTGERFPPSAHDLLWFAGWGLFCLAPVFIWLGWTGGITVFFRDTFLVGSTLLSAWGKPTPPLHAPMVELLKNPFLLLSNSGVWQRWWFPLLLYLAILTASLASTLFSKKNSRTPLLLSLSGVFFFVIALGRTDLDHWLKGLPVFWIVMFWLIHDSWRVFRGKERSLAQRVSGFIVLSVFVLFTFRFWNWQRVVAPIQLTAQLSRSLAATSPSEPELYRWGATPMDSDENQVYRSVIERLWMCATPGETLFNFTDDSLFLYLANMKNATRYANISFVVGQKMEEEVLEDLYRHPPKCVLVRMAGGEIVSKPYHHRIREYLNANFIEAGHYQDFSILKPRDS